ncbi:MAG: hypothetical protein NTU44_09675 [Bacteroidetes bacterium]|nr:hypothetical protein [Bacteroidota bacterium]
MERSCNILKRVFLFTTLVCLAFFFHPFTGLSLPQGGAPEKKPAALALTRVKMSNGDHQMKVVLSSTSENGRTLLAGLPVTFVGGKDLSVKYSEQKTNARGVAMFTIPKDKLPAKDPDGTITLGVKFDGNKEYEPAEEQAGVKDLTIEVTTEVADTVRSVKAFAFEVDEKGAKVPLKATDIAFYVPRMFSYLKIGEGSLDSSGVCVVEFPKNLPGDSAGKVTVIARIEDNDIFGNVEGSTRVDWAVPTQHFVKESYRALWSQIAPTWMIITLIILLTGVWGHYTYAVVKLFQIRKEGKNLSS